MSIKAHGNGGQPSSLPCMILLALCFLGGVLLGQMMAGRVPAETGTELNDYLRHYVAAADHAPADALPSALALYLRYPLLAVLFGFASAGVVLLPCAALLFGLFLSFSVCCFTAAFGVEGVLLALAVFGLRCAVTLPVFFLLAVPAWRSAAALAALSFGKGRRTAAPVIRGRAWWRRTGVCCLALLAGVCGELLFTPALLRWVLDRILT